MANNHIIIGLGGTGGQIIKEYRKLYVNKHQNLDGLDNVKFLWFDTSEDDMAKTDEWKVNGISVALEKNVESFYMKTGGTNVFDILNDTSNYPAIASWIGSYDNEWDPAKINSKVVDGASGQIRVLGRVNFALYVDEFIKIVKKTVNSFILDTTNAGVDVHIVVGLAGGTGSGSFIDATAQILEEDNGIKVESVFVYPLTPSTTVPNDNKGNINGVSLYHANGYAALKELNAFSIANSLDEDAVDFQDSTDILGGLNLYDLSDADYGDKLYGRKRYQAAYIVTDEAVSGNEQRFIKTANWLYIKTLFINKGFIEKTNRIDTGENRSKTPASLWGQTSDNIGFGTMRLMVPKQQMRDYFKNYFLINALKKIQYNNFKDKEGFLFEPAEIDREKYIETHTILLREWGLTIPQLSLDKIDVELPLIHKHYSPKDFSIEEEIKVELLEMFNHIENSGYNNNPVEEVDLLTIYNTAGLSFIRTKFRSVGATKFYQDWSKNDNIYKYTDFIKAKILTNIFGYNSAGTNNWMPLSGYVELVKYIRQDYFNELKETLSQRIQICNQRRESLISDFNVFEVQYKKAFGIFGSKSKRSDNKTKAQNTLVELYSTMVEEEAFSFALKIISELQKNTLVDVEKVVDEATTGVNNLIKRYLKQLSEEDPRVKRNSSNGIEAYSPGGVIDKMEEYLNRSEDDLSDYIKDIESEVYAEVKLLTEGKTDMKAIEKSLDELGAKEADKGLKKNTAGIELDYDVYKDNLITILFKDYGENADSTELKNIINNIYIKSAPAIKLKETDIKAEDLTLVILPMLVDVEDEKEVAFKLALEKIIKGICTNPIIINTVEDDKHNRENKDSKAYKEGFDEIVMVRFKSFFPLSSLDVIQKKLYKEYTSCIDKLETNNGINAKFLMHIQDASHIPEIIPIKDQRRIDLYRPYVILLQAMDTFDKGKSILQIEELDKDFGDPIETKSFYFDKTFEETLKGDIFYQNKRTFANWKKNRWISSVTYYALKELTLEKAKKIDKDELLKNLIIVSDELKEKTPKLYKEVSKHFNEIKGIINYLHEKK